MLENTLIYLQKHDIYHVRETLTNSVQTSTVYIFTLKKLVNFLP